jgi:hypothetical protein
MTGYGRILSDGRTTGSGRLPSLLIYRRSIRASISLITASFSLL